MNPDRIDRLINDLQLLAFSELANDFPATAKVLSNAVLVLKRARDLPNSWANREADFGCRQTNRAAMDGDECGDELMAVLNLEES